MRNPRVMSKAQAEVRRVLQGKPKAEVADLQKLEYLRAVVKETLRLHPPAPLFPRESRETCEPGGYKIQAKTKVIINEWAIGRDPESWVDAESSFKPEKFLHGGSDSDIDFKASDFKFTPFGAGRRSCPGISFGLSMVELALSQLLYHFYWELEDGMKPEELDMTESFGFTCRRNNKLYLIANRPPSSFSLVQSETSIVIDHFKLYVFMSTDNQTPFE